MRSTCLLAFLSLHIGVQVAVGEVHVSINSRSNTDHDPQEFFCTVGCQ